MTVELIVEVCDVRTRITQRREYRNGQLVRVQVWIGNCWCDPFELLAFVEVPS